MTTYKTRADLIERIIELEAALASYDAGVSDREKLVWEELNARIAELEAAPPYAAMLDKSLEYMAHIAELEAARFDPDYIQHLLSRIAELETVLAEAVHDAREWKRKAKEFETNYSDRHQSDEAGDEKRSG